MDSMNNIGREISLFPMNAGDGAHSYLQNSSYQRAVVDVAKPIIEEEIATKFDIKHLKKRGILIADFGCSTGHNSFPAVQIITQAIKRIHESAEFLVLFNDVVSNNFNTLFTSLPAGRNYHATGVPGDFHGRLLPESCLHFAYSSWSLHWLSRVPEGVADSGSPAWNKGAITYTENRKEVCDAYLEQFSNDMGAFLESRAVEMAGGGLMALFVPGVPQFLDPQTEYTIYSDFCILMGTCLMDMAKMGRLSEEKIDSFNLPVYFTTPQQLRTILERNHSFRLERMEILNNTGNYTLPSINARAATYRAVYECLLTDHFGGEIIDELFDLYKKKLAALPVFLNPENDKSIVILAVLKRD